MILLLTQTSEAYDSIEMECPFYYLCWIIFWQAVLIMQQLSISSEAYSNQLCVPIWLKW